MGKVKRVLIYRLGSLGDTVVALPSLHLVACAFPGAERRLLTNFPVDVKAPPAAAVLENSGLVDGYFHYAVGTRSVLALAKLWWQLRRWRPDVLVYLGAARGVQSARRDARFFRLCGIREMVGVPLTEVMQQNFFGAETPNGLASLEPEAARLARNIATLGDARLNDAASWDLLLTAAERERAWAEIGEQALASPLIAVSVGTKVQAKDWGRENWRALLAKLAQAYPNHALLLAGAEEESEASEYAADGWRAACGGAVRNVCGRLTPRESAAALSLAKIFIGHDSGPLHLAAVVQTPCVAIFAARNIPRVWFPFGEKHRVLYHRVDCMGCGLETCIVEGKKCILSITVDEVAAELKQALQRIEAQSQLTTNNRKLTPPNAMMNQESKMLPEIHKVLSLLEGGFAELKVLVVGDLMLDRYILGEVDRISPEAPVPVLRHVKRYETPGGAANVAMNLAGLGCQTLLAGFWGNDAEQKELAAFLDKANIDTTGVVSTSLPTISKTRIVGRQQQLLRLDIESREKPSEADCGRLLESAEQLAGKVHAIVLSDYAKGALSAELCERVIRAARRAGVPILADPKATDFSKYSGATTVCPNLGELAGATGVSLHEVDALLIAGDALRKEHDLRFLTVTMSEKGIRILSEEGTFHSPTRAREVFDVSGAGDTVIATLAAGLAAGLKVHTAVELSNLAAGIVVGKVGTVPIARHELIAALTPSSSFSASEKVLNRERLATRIEEWRAAGQSIVFTNGCFDLLHVGHVTLLEDCHKFGSKLVLGLNSDASVSRLKGPARPIVGERERSRVMAALAAVDAVVLFDEDTPLELIREIKPDVLVKGGDYSVETVVGHQDVIAAGGRVEIVPTVEGFSTTNIVQKLRNDRG